MGKKDDFDGDFDDLGMDEFFPLDDPEKDSKVTVGSYATNLAKSAKKAVTGTIDMFLPEANNLIMQMGVAKDETADEIRTGLNKTADYINKNTGGKGIKNLINTWKKEFITDVKKAVTTGDLTFGANKGMSFDTGDDFDISDDDNTTESGGAAYIKGVKAQVKATDNISNVNLNIFKSTARMNAKLAMSGRSADDARHMQSIGYIANIDSNVEKIASYFAEIGTKGVAAQMEYSEKSLAMQLDSMNLLNAIKEQTYTPPTEAAGKDRRGVLDDMFGSGLDGSGFGKHVRGNVKDMVSNSPIGMMMMGLDMLQSANGMGPKKTMGERAMGGLLSHIPKLLLTGKAQDKLSKTNDMIANIPKLMNGKFSSWANNSNNPILQTLGSLMGVKEMNNRSADLGVKDLDAKANFDKKFYGSVTNAIPGLLSKILASVSGKGEVYFDHTTGGFKEASHAVKAFKYERDSVLKSNSLFNDLNNKLLTGHDKLAKSTKQDPKILIKDFEKIAANIAKSGEQFNPNTVFSNQEYYNLLTNGLKNPKVNMGLFVDQYGKHFQKKDQVDYAHSSASVGASIGKFWNQTFPEMANGGAGSYIINEAMDEDDKDRKLKNKLADKSSKFLDENGKVIPGMEIPYNIYKAGALKSEKYEELYNGGRAETITDRTFSKLESNASDTIDDTATSLNKIYELLLGGILVYPKSGTPEHLKQSIEAHNLRKANGAKKAEDDAVLEENKLNELSMKEFEALKAKDDAKSALGGTLSGLTDSWFNRGKKKVVDKVGEANVKKYENIKDKLNHAVEDGVEVFDNALHRFLFGKNATYSTTGISVADENAKRIAEMSELQFKNVEKFLKTKSSDLNHILNKSKLETDVNLKEETIDNMTLSSKLKSKGKRILTSLGEESSGTGINQEALNKHIKEGVAESVKAGTNIESAKHAKTKSEIKINDNSNSLVSGGSSSNNKGIENYLKSIDSNVKILVHKPNKSNVKDTSGISNNIESAIDKLREATVTRLDDVIRVLKDIKCDTNEMIPHLLDAIDGLAVNVANPAGVVQNIKKRGRKRRALGRITGSLATGATSVVGGIASFYGNIIGGAGHLLKGAGKLGGDGFVGLGKMIKASGHGIGAGVGGIAQGIGGLYKGVFGGLGGLASKALPGLGGLIGGAADGIGKLLPGVGAGLGGVAQGIGGLYKGVLGGAGGIIGGVGSRVGKIIGGRNTKPNMKTKHGIINFEKSEDALNAILNEVRSIRVKMIGGGDVLKGVKETSSEAAEAMKDGAKKAGNWIKGKWNKGRKKAEEFSEKHHLAEKGAEVLETAKRHGTKIASDATNYATNVLENGIDTEDLKNKAITAKNTVISSAKKVASFSKKQTRRLIASVNDGSLLRNIDKSLSGIVDAYGDGTLAEKLKYEADFLKLYGDEAWVEFKKKYNLDEKINNVAYKADNVIDSVKSGVAGGAKTVSKKIKQGKAALKEHNENVKYQADWEAALLERDGPIDPDSADREGSHKDQVKDKAEAESKANEKKSSIALTSIAALMAKMFKSKKQDRKELIEALEKSEIGENIEKTAEKSGGGIGALAGAGTMVAGAATAAVGAGAVAVGGALVGASVGTAAYVGKKLYDKQKLNAKSGLYDKSTSVGERLTEEGGLKTSSNYGFDGKELSEEEKRSRRMGFDKIRSTGVKTVLGVGKLGGKLMGWGAKKVIKGGKGMVKGGEMMVDAAAGASKVFSRIFELLNKALSSKFAQKFVKKEMVKPILDGIKKDVVNPSLLKKLGSNFVVKFIGKFLGPISFALTMNDFITGWQNAPRYFKLGAGAHCTGAMNIASAIANVLSSFTFGILSAESIVHTIYNITASKGTKAAVDEYQKFMAAKAALFGVDVKRFSEFETKNMWETWFSNSSKDNAKLLGFKTPKEFDDWNKHLYAPVQQMRKKLSRAYGGDKVTEGILSDNALAKTDGLVGFGTTVESLIDKQRAYRKQFLELAKRIIDVGKKQLGIAVKEEPAPVKPETKQVVEKDTDNIEKTAALAGMSAAALANAGLKEDAGVARGATFAKPSTAPTTKTTTPSITPGEPAIVAGAAAVAGTKAVDEIAKTVGVKPADKINPQKGEVKEALAKTGAKIDAPSTKTKPADSSASNIKNDIIVIPNKKSLSESPVVTGMNSMTDGINTELGAQLAILAEQTRHNSISEVTASKMLSLLTILVDNSKASFDANKSQNEILAKSLLNEVSKVNSSGTPDKNPIVKAAEAAGKGIHDFVLGDQDSGGKNKGLLGGIFGGNNKSQQSSSSKTNSSRGNSREIALSGSDDQFLGGFGSTPTPQTGGGGGDMADAATAAYNAANPVSKTNMSGSELAKYVNDCISGGSASHEIYGPSIDVNYNGKKIGTSVTYIPKAGASGLREGDCFIVKTMNNGDKEYSVDNTIMNTNPGLKISSAGRFKGGSNTIIIRENAPVTKKAETFPNTGTKSGAGFISSGGRN